MHKIDAYRLNSTCEHQIATGSPESIQKVAQPTTVPSTTPLVVTLPGKLPIIKNIATHNIECHLI